MLEKTQCFPFYVYDEDGTNRRENITDWALEQFRQHYGDETISKWDIFYYVYAVLHHPEYRSRFAENLKRELPRIPFLSEKGKGESEKPSAVSDALLQGMRDSNPPLPESTSDVEPQPAPFHSSLSTFHFFSEAGKKLADLHLNYETLTPYPLEYVWAAGKPVSYRVEKMRLEKKPSAVSHQLSAKEPGSEAVESGEPKDFPLSTFHFSLRVNDALTLRGIPAEAFEYRLGNRSALDWVIDQYQVKTDAKSGMTSDPNGWSDDEKYIVELVGRVVNVSVQTVEIVKTLAGYPLGK